MHMDIEAQYDKIYRYCYFRMKHVQKAEDITQETFLRFLSSEYRDTGRPLAYLYTIAKNLCVDAFREREALPLDEEPQDAGFENKVVISLALQEALNSLTEEERELLLLRYVNELSYANCIMSPDLHCTGGCQRLQRNWRGGFWMNRKDPVRDHIVCSHCVYRKCDGIWVGRLSCRSLQYSGVMVFLSAFRRRYMADYAGYFSAFRCFVFHHNHGTGMGD